MKKITNYLLFGWLTVLLGVASCTSPSDISVERETVDLAFPVFTSETTISDLIDSGQDSTALIVYADNSMGLVYASETEVEVPMPEFEKIDVNLQSPITEVPSIGLSGVQLDKAKFVAGTLNFDFTNNVYSEHVKIVVRINQFSKNNTILSETFHLNYDGSLPVVEHFSVDLADYRMDISNSPLQIEYQASLDNGTMANIDEAKMEMIDADFAWLAGEWAEKTMPLNIPSQEIGFFEHNTNSGNVNFSNPKLRIVAVNSVGVASKLLLNAIEMQTIDNEQIALTGNHIANGFSLAYPTFNQLGTGMFSSIEFNKTNSNIVEAFNAQSKRISFDADYKISPDGVHNGFLAKNSKVDLNMRVELPFSGTVDGFQVAKEFDMKFTNEHVKAAYLKLHAVNQIPLDARVQLYFLDNADVVLDSIVSSNGILAIKAADVNAKGEVVKTKTWEEEIKIDMETWENIKGAIKVRLVTAFTSSSQAQVPVSVKSNQVVQLNAGLKLVVLP